MAQMTSSALLADYSFVGDLLAPSVFLVASLAFTVWLARATRLRQEHDQLVQRDQRYVDEFLLATRALKGWKLVNAAPKQALAWTNDLWRDAERLNEFVSGTYRRELYHFLAERYQAISGIMQELATAQFEHRAATGVLGYPRAFADNHHSAMAQDLDQFISDMRAIARDWPTIERRRFWLKKIAAAAILQWPVQPTDFDLVLERQMLASLPSRSRPKQALRTIRIVVRELADDYRFDRLDVRFAAWRSRAAAEITWLREGPERRRRARWEARERHELHRLYDLAARYYQQRGERMPWPVPYRMDALSAAYNRPTPPPDAYL